MTRIRRSGDNSVVTGVLLDSQTSTPYLFGLVWKYILKGCRVGVAMMRSGELQHAAKELVICLLAPCSLAVLSCYNVLESHIQSIFNIQSVCAWRNNAASKLDCN